MDSGKNYRGKCFCGAVEIELTGEPVAMGYCHCGSCRSWAASPVNAFSLWQPAGVRILKGADSLGVYNKTPISHRKWCRTCGGHVLTEHPTMGLVDVYAATIPEFPFKPALHINYQEAVLRVRDGLPKMKDIPAEMGGSGQTLPE
jgi:hypothetical protein